MFTSTKLYTLDADNYENGVYDKKSLVVNSLDMEFFSYIMVIPSYRFDAKEIKTIEKQQANVEFWKKQYQSQPAKLLIAFQPNANSKASFNESDIALDTNIYGAL